MIDMIAAGEERPPHVSEKEWAAAERQFFRQMDIENTPDEYIAGTAAYYHEHY